MLLDNYKKESPIVGIAGLGGGINSYIFLSSGSDYVISRSLRFNDNDSAYLSRTPSSASDRQKWTWAAWVKKTSLTTNNTLFSADASNSDFVTIRFEADTIRFDCQGDGQGRVQVTTAAVYRDPSAWYHIVIALDTTQSTAADRCKIYINNILQTTSNTITQNKNFAVNSTVNHEIGRRSDGNDHYFDGYLADVHLVDGQQLSATDFGKFDLNEVWQPKKYSGSHGTNGFHLDFKDNSSNAALGYDDAGSNNFTVSNLTAPSAVVNAIDLDGNDQIEYPGPGDGISGDFTMECFFLMDSSASGFERIFSTKEDSYSDEQTFIRRNNSGNIGFCAGNSSPVYFDPSSGSTITSGVWHHAAIVRESGTISWYYDGTRKGTASYSTSFDITKLLVGGGYGSEQFNGDVHGARFTLGQALYSGSSYTVPTSAITTTSQGATASNVKVLAGTTSTVNENVGTLGNGTNSGDPTAVSAYPFGDPANIDSLLDSPSQNIEDQTDSGLGGELISNYATYNGVRTGSGTKSNGGLTVTGTGQIPDVTSIAPNSGKWYAEIKWDSGSYARIGLQDVNIATSDFGGVNGQSYRYESNSGNVQPGGQTYSTYAAGDIIGIAFDCDAGKLWLAKNGTWQNSGNPASGTGAVATNLVSGSHYAPASSSGSGSSVFTLNAGQRAFAYTAPTGFKCLCSDNLTATIESPSTYFDTFLYTGNGAASRNLTLPLAADFLWVKKRSATNSHQLVDTVRGDNSVLHTNSNNRAKNPQTQFSGGGVSSLSGTTATLSQGTSNNDNVNADTSTLVGWAWEGGSSDKTYTITVANPGSGNKYHVDGAQQPTLTLAEGSTYKFDQSDSSNATHPLRFSTSSDGTHGGGTEYTTGVTTVGTPGSAGAYTQIVIASNAPLLYAYCANHSGMGFQVNTSEVAGYTIPAGAFNDTDYDRSKSWISLVTTSSLSSDYNSYSATSKLGALDGKRSTALYGIGNQALTITFDASAFPSSDGPYIVEVENNQRAITLNGSQTGSSWPGQATGWQKFDSVSTITSISSAHASSHYGGMINRIRVNGKVLADPTATPDNIPSVSTQVLASPESGFSISKWQGNAAEATVAHGLNSTPLLYFVKSLDNDEDWEVLTNLIGTNPLDKAVLNTTAAFGISYHQVPTNHIIGRPNGDANGENMLAYCFAPVEGYSAVGKYFSGSANNFIYVGFRPKFLLVKKTAASADDAYEGWIIFDSERDSYNISDESLFANNSQQKGLRGNGASSIPTNFGVDFLSNGFCFKDNSTEYNRADVGTYIYYAVAEHPFNSSRAR